MDSVIVPILGRLPDLIAAAPAADAVPTLLITGGFAFVTAVMGGLFLMNKNKADGAKAIAEGAREYVEGATESLRAAREESASARHEAEKARDDLRLARREAGDARDELRAAHRLLDDAQAAIRAGQRERLKLKQWIRDQCAANAQHQEWDVELQILLDGCDMHIRPAPPLMVTPPNGDDG